MKIRLLYLLILVFNISCNGKDRVYKNSKLALSDIIENQGFDENKISVQIDKSDYKLSVLIDTIILKEYPVVFGGNPEDDKLQQGDKCTPEGKFKMASKYPHQKWSKFILINYPNEDSWKKHNLAKKEGKIPKDSKIGGQIGIHGVPKNMDKLIDFQFNWTAGCISMKNEDVDEIYPYISESTIIEIKK